MDASQPPGVRYAIRVGPGDVGRRAVLRRRLPGGGLGDVLGDLVSWEAGVVTVRTRGGPVEVAVADLVAGKPVPPAPVRRPAAGPAVPGRAGPPDPGVPDP